MSAYKIPEEFKPPISHQLYLIRTELYKAILQRKEFMTGVMVDFGCGAKPYRSLFEVEKYIGVDYNGEGHSHDDEHIDVYYDGEKLPFSDGSIDSVFSSEVFEHIFNLEQIILELNRVLKPEGILLFTCPFVWNEHEVPNDYARYTQFALRDLLKKGGFEVIEMAKAGNFWITLMQLFQLWLPIPRFFYRIPYSIKIIYGGVNIAALALRPVLPKRSDLYLNNIVVARKV